MGMRMVKLSEFAKAINSVIQKVRVMNWLSRRHVLSYFADLSLT
jgi:hypothetical protein